MLSVFISLSPQTPPLVTQTEGWLKTLPVGCHPLPRPSKRRKRTEWKGKCEQTGGGGAEQHFLASDMETTRGTSGRG